MPRTTGVEFIATKVSRVSLALMSTRVTASLGSKGCAKPKHALCDCQQPDAKFFCSMRVRVGDGGSADADAASTMTRSMCSQQCVDAARAFRGAGKNSTRVASTWFSPMHFACVHAARGATVRMRACRMNRCCDRRRAVHVPLRFPASHKVNCAKVRGKFSVLRVHSRRCARSDTCLRRCRTIVRRALDDASGDRVPVCAAMATSGGNIATLIRRSSVPIASDARKTSARGAFCGVVSPTDVRRNTLGRYRSIRSTPPEKLPTRSRANRFRSTEPRSIDRAVEPSPSIAAMKRQACTAGNPRPRKRFRPHKAAGIGTAKRDATTQSSSSSSSAA